jgi:hypothetical protein
VDNARKRLCHEAKSLGYIVTREEADGVVTVCLVRVQLPARVFLVEIVPEDHKDDPWPLGERIVASGVAVPHRITPREVPRLLGLLADIERSTT